MSSKLDRATVSRVLRVESYRVQKEHTTERRTGHTLAAAALVASVTAVALGVVAGRSKLVGITVFGFGVMLAGAESGRLLGGRLVGREGVKRIDTVATALHAEGTVSERQTAALAYAPPFSPVRDPVLTAAKALSGKVD